MTTHPDTTRTEPRSERSADTGADVASWVAGRLRFERLLRRLEATDPD